MIRNYWLDKAELEARTVEIIEKYLADAIAKQVMFLEPQHVQNEIGVAVLAGIGSAYGSMYRVVYDVSLKVDIVTADLGLGNRQYYVVKAYENVTAEIM